MEKIIFCYFAPKHSQYTPLDIGYAVATLKQKEYNKDNIVILNLSYFEPNLEIDPIHREIEEILRHNPQMVIFFVENIWWSRVFAWKRAKKMAAGIKKRNPAVIIGAQSYKASKDHIDSAFKEGSFDFIVRGNPDRPFLNWEDIKRQNPVPGIIYKNYEERNENFDEIEPMGHKLDNLPSPYLTGIFDEFLEDKQRLHKGNFRAFLYASQGCNFGCYYCWRSVRSERIVNFFPVERFYDEIEYLHKKFKINQFFILDDTFSLSKIRLQEFEKEFEKRKGRAPSMSQIEILCMCRAEKFDQESARMLKNINIIWIQMGLQTVNPALQHYMNRKVEIEKFKNIAQWLQENNIKLCLDIILGLPGDSLEYAKKTIDFAVSLKPYSIRINRFFLNPGTLFHAQQEKYQIELENKLSQEFGAPYAAKARGIDEKYFPEMKKYLQEKIKEHPEINWLRLFLF